MSAEEPLKPELAALQAALASLTPQAAGLDRDRVMYLAGRAAACQTARRRGAAWLWPCATAASLMLAVVLGLRGQRPSQPAPVAASAPAPYQSDANEYFKLRELVLARGVDALPEPTVSSDRGDAQPLRPLDRKHLDAWLGG